ILRNIGVEQVQVEAAYLETPNLDPDLAGGQTHRYLQIGAGRIAHRLDGQGKEIVGRIPLLLPAVRIQILPEVASLVEQSDTDQRNGAIAGGLQMVPGENPQAAGIDWQALGEAVLRRKVGDERT